MNNLFKQSYYYVKPFVPKRLNLYLRRKYFNYYLSRYRDIWPINEEVEIHPPGWQGWPDDKEFALILTHDVEGNSGQKKCYKLADLEMQLGFRSSFNFVAEDYHQDETLKRFLMDNGFEIGLHGLVHSGNLFRTKAVFSRQLPKIKKYLKDWKAVGFRAPSMYHNLEWIHEFGIEYDSSTFDTDPFEPQPDGAGTIFPFLVNNKHGEGGYVELPYTLPQDFTIFILKQEKDNRIWQQKLDWIAHRKGMALIITHPDYMNFDEGKPSIGEYPANYYRDFLIYIKENYKDLYWHDLPREVARFWIKNYNPESKTPIVCPSVINSPTFIPSQTDAPQPVIASEAKQSLLLVKPTDKVIEIDPLKDPRWDTFVENHPNGWIVHLSGWKTLIEKSFPHMKGHYLAIVDSSTNEIRAAMPLFEVRSWLLGNRLVSIPHATICDPLVSTYEEMAVLIESALNLARKLRVIPVEIRTFVASKYVIDNRFGMSNVFKIQYLQLDRKPEEIMKLFHPTSVRQRIRKAMKSNLTVTSANSESDVYNFYCLNLMTRHRLNLPPQPYSYFKSLWEIFSPSRRIEILIAKNNEQIIAAVMLLKFKDRVSAEFTVWDKTFQDLNANYILYWEAIKLAYSEGYKIFDLGRTSQNNVDLMSYKERWGTNIIDLPQFYYPKNFSEKSDKRENTFSYKIVQNICNITPQLYLKYIGNFCYRHMG